MGLLALCIRWTKAFHTPATFYKRRHLFDVVQIEVELSLLTNHEVSLSDSAPNGPVGIRPASRGNKNGVTSG